MRRSSPGAPAMRCRPRCAIDAVRPSTLGGGPRRFRRASGSLVHIPSMRILLAEDDQQLRDALARGLREETFAVDAVADGNEALTLALVNDYDLLVLDVMMPGQDGFTICRRCRERAIAVPILLLTARDAVHDRIAGLDAGADDYLTKPFVFGELLARMRALLRRGGTLLPSTLQVDDLSVDTRRHLVHRAGREIRLTAKEYAFVEYLARHAGRVVARTELSIHVWDGNHEPAANLVDVYVSRLRRKIDDGAATPLLHTRRGHGVLLGADPAARASE
jgi:two-component system copper resistance phosphate regulon response regulator CusR